MHLIHYPVTDETFMVPYKCTLYNIYDTDRNVYHMIIFSRICHYASCTILNLPKEIDVIITHAILYRLTIVHTRCNNVTDYSYN